MHFPAVLSVARATTKDAPYIVYLFTCLFTKLNMLSKNIILKWISL